MSKHIRKLGLYSRQLDVALNTLDRASRHLRVPSDLKADLVRALQDIRQLEVHHDAVIRSAVTRTEKQAA